MSVFTFTFTLVLHKVYLKFTFTLGFMLPNYVIPITKQTIYLKSTPNVVGQFFKQGYIYVVQLMWKYVFWSYIVQMRD